VPLSRPGGACFAGAARSWWGPDRGPLGLRPLARGVFFRVPRESSSSGVLPTTNARRNAHPPPEAPYLDASSKAPLRLLPDAFHRRMPARPDACTPNLEREPATESRFCHPGLGFRRSFAPSPREGEGARPRRFPELIAPVRSRPRVVRRLLPTRRSASTTIGRSTPGLGCADAAFAWSSPGAGPRFVPLASPFDRGSSRTAEPRALGSGAFLMSIRARALLDRHPPAAMARGGGFAPTRCGSDTSCRASALPPAGVAGVMRGAPTNLR
jgi:hypothetical protein